jgi:hypothetical protein
MKTRLNSDGHQFNEEWRTSASFMLKRVALVLSP